MKTSSLKIYVTDEHRTKLEGLCKALGVSPQRGKSFTISKLIEHTYAPNGELFMKDLASKEMVDLLREQYGNLARVGGNLNQFIHLLQIRRIRLERGEEDELVVELPFVLSALKELVLEVEEVKETITSITERY